MFGILRFARAHRRHPVVRAAASACRRFLAAYENAGDYDIATNGEAAVLAAMAGSEVRCVLDVGANAGDWTLAARARFPEATIHAFEVLPATADRLARRLAGVPGVIVNPFGLSSTAGPARLKLFDGHDALTTMIEADPAADAWLRQSAPTGVADGTLARGDDYLAEHRIDAVDLLKVDVEGVELEVLRGFQSALCERRIAVIQFEYGSGSIVTGHLLRDFYRLLAPCGYRIGKIYPDYVEFRDYRAEHEDFLGPNFLAVRDDLDALIARLSR